MSNSMMEFQGAMCPASIEERKIDDLREHVNKKLAFLAGQSALGGGGSDPRQLRNAILFLILKKEKKGRFEMKSV